MITAISTGVLAANHFSVSSRLLRMVCLPTEGNIDIHARLAYSESRKCRSICGVTSGRRCCVLRLLSLHRLQVGGLPVLSALDPAADAWVIVEDDLLDPGGRVGPILDGLHQGLGQAACRSMVPTISSTAASGHWEAFPLQPAHKETKVSSCSRAEGIFTPTISDGRRRAGRPLVVLPTRRQTGGPLSARPVIL